SVPCPPPRQPTPPLVWHRLPMPPPIYHVNHHHHVAVILVGAKPGVLVKHAKPYCTWCKFLPGHLDVSKPTEYFSAHTYFALHSEYTVTIPKVMESAQRIYVDFVGDEMI
ncbi:hypothetical protein LPJ57_007246, partial [Coemansia sp. RSA 486]